MAHTTRSPSGHSRWKRCTASPAFIEKLREKGYELEIPSPYADEGTLGHEVLALSFDLGLTPYDFVGETVFVNELGKAYVVDSDMCSHLNESYEYIKSFIREKYEIWIEIKMSLDKVCPGEKGTADIVLLVYEDDRWVLHVFDLKYGYGIPVPVFENGQLILYTIGVMDNLLDFEMKKKLSHIVIHVVQPRLNNMEGWRISKGELEKWRLRIHQEFLETKDPSKAKFIPGEHCRFCDAKVRCKKLKESIFNHIIDDPFTPGIDAFKNPDTMSDSELDDLSQFLDFLTGWVKNTKEYMRLESLRGREFKRLKLVPGQKGTRQWVNEEKARKELFKELDVPSDKHYNHKLISPAQLESLVGRKNIDQEVFKSYITQASAKPILVSKDDPRKTFKQSMIDEFDD